MFDKIEFANVLKKINETFDNQTKFSKAAKVNRTYLSQYMNLKLDSPPSPKVLRGIADASNGLVSYAELMEICGYLSLNNNILSDEEKILYLKELQTESNYMHSNIEDLKKEMFMVYYASDSSMAPLLDIDDKAYIFKKNSFKSGETILFILEEKEYIRKIIDYGEYIEFHAMNPYYPPMKYDKKTLEQKGFKIIGKVIKVELFSAFR